MKTIKTILAFLILSLFTISCSKDDEPSVKPPSTAISFENATEVTILDATYGNGSPIPTSTYSLIEVAANGTILDLKKIVLEMNISHDYQSDLSFALIAPDGTESSFVHRVGGSSDYVGENKLRFSATFSNPKPNSNVNVPAGDYKESQGTGLFSVPVLTSIFSTLQNKSVNGTWKLKATDSDQFRVGKIISWKLIFEAGALNQ